MYLVGLKINWKYHFLNYSLAPNTSTSYNTCAFLSNKAWGCQEPTVQRKAPVCQFSILSSVVFPVVLGHFRTQEKSIILVSLCRTSPRVWLLSFVQLPWVPRWLRAHRWPVFFWWTSWSFTRPDEICHSSFPWSLFGFVDWPIPHEVVKFVEGMC